MTTDFNQWIAARKEGEASESPELEALESCLDESISLSDAVQRITARSYTWNSSQPARVSWMLLYLARDRADTHECIIEIIKAIFALPPPEDPNEINWREETDCFRFAWCSMQDMIREVFDNAKNNVSDETARHLINFHAFSAAAIAEYIRLIDIGWGFLAIAQGIEVKVRLPVTQPQNVKIIAAAQYFIHASGFILNFPPGGNTHVLWEDDSELWKGAKGYSLDRWAWWKKRWEELRQNEALSDDAREAARQSEVAMSKAERRKDKGRKKN